MTTEGSDVLCLFCGSSIPREEVLSVSVEMWTYQGTEPGPAQLVWAHVSCFTNAVPQEMRWTLRPELGGPETFQSEGP